MRKALTLILYVLFCFALLLFFHFVRHRRLPALPTTRFELVVWIVGVVVIVAVAVRIFLEELSAQEESPDDE